MTARVVLPGRLPNTRDLGGLRRADGAVLRDRRLVRTAALVGLDAGVADALHDELGPAVYVDLRTDREVDRDGGPDALLERGWRWRRIPVFDLVPDEEQDSLRRCARFMPLYLATAAEVAGLLGDGPVVVGCAVGKDRTGIIMTVLLHWLGVPPADIAADYVRSNGFLADGRHLLPPLWQDPATRLTQVHERFCLGAIDLLGAQGAAAEPPAHLADLDLWTLRSSVGAGSA
ncbi:tyrosine-protein phosphatase [Actinokineospora soli]|uniref:Tyrosine-protein phosphatase n=1 Tax=Actinokineospora soli TaxID=1048753 RepID=A0ABW2TT78_9PSEU